MSSDSRVASRYAKSVVVLAQEQGKLDKIKEDAELLTETCNESKELRMLLKNPIIISSKKFAILSKLFESKMDNMMITFFKIVCSKGRSEVLYSIGEEIIREYNLIKGIQKAVVKTSSPLSTEMKDKLISIVKADTGKEVEMEEVIDQELIGGFVLKVGDKQIDESVQSKLQKLKVSFSK